MKTQFGTISKMTLIAVALVALITAPVMAQSGADKDTKKLKEKVGKARESLGAAVGQVKEMVSTGHVVGRVLVGGLETLSTKAIAVLVADLKQEHLGNQHVEAARRTIELFVQERLTRDQIEASERLTEQLIATQVGLADQAKAARRLGYVISVAVGLVGLIAALARFL